MVPCYDPIPTGVLALSRTFTLGVGGVSKEGTRGRETQPSHLSPAYRKGCPCGSPGGMNLTQGVGWDQGCPVWLNWARCTLGGNGRTQGARGALGLEAGVRAARASQVSLGDLA